MHLMITRSLTGYTLIVILSSKVISCADPCTIDQFNGSLRATCKGIELVPTSLDSSIKYLDLSGNTKLKSLDANVFDRYKNLIWLSLRNCSILSALPTPYGGFKSLENLEHLDISGLKHGGNSKEYALPFNLKVLIMNNTDIGDLIATDLLKLEYVDLSYNLKMVTFPLFGPTAKVQTVILMHVKLDHLVVSQIAPNCHLKRLDLYIDLDGGSELLEPNKFCECLNIGRWVKQFEIESNLIQDPLKCRKIEEKQADTEICKKDDSYTAALNERKKCLKLANPTFSWFLVFGGVLVLLLIVMVVGIFIMDIKMLRHIHHAHKILTGKNKSDDDEEESKSEEQGTPEE